MDRALTLDSLGVTLRADHGIAASRQGRTTSFLSVSDAPLRCSPTSRADGAAPASVLRYAFSSGIHPGGGERAGDMLARVEVHLVGGLSLES